MRLIDFAMREHNVARERVRDAIIVRLIRVGIVKVASRMNTTHRKLQNRVRKGNFTDLMVLAYEIDQALGDTAAGAAETSLESI